jgi:hypothetical protein
VLAPTAPVAHADVLLRCHGREITLASTDPEGHFRWSGDREVPTDCEIVITKPGFRSASSRVDDVCVDRSKGDCENLTFTADLEPI